MEGPRRVFPCPRFLRLADDTSSIENRRHALVLKEDGLIVGLEELLADQPLRRLLGSECRRLAEEQFS